jgi:hypothetical protein
MHRQQKRTAPLGADRRPAKAKHRGLPRRDRAPGNRFARAKPLVLGDLRSPSQPCPLCGLPPSSLPRHRGAEGLADPHSPDQGSSLSRGFRFLQPQKGLGSAEQSL